MRKRVTHAFGGHFIESIVLLSYVGVPGDYFRSSWGALRPRFDVLAALFDAQAAQFRVGILCFLKQK